MTTLKKILTLLSPSERRKGYLLLVMILIRALLDTVGVASIMPFISVLSKPSVIETNRWLAMAYNRLGFTDTRSFLFFLGGVVFFVQIGSIVFKGLTYWALLRFTYMRNYSISCRLLQGYLGRPYVWFLSRNSADLGKTLLSEVEQVVRRVIIPAMELLAQGAVIILLVILLVLVDPFLAVVAASGLGGAYVAVYLALRRPLLHSGTDRVKANRERFQIVQEAFAAIKEVKVFAREREFFRRFQFPSYRYARHQSNSQLANRLPKYGLEAIAFGGILLLILYLLHTRGELSNFLPVLSLYAFAGYRLMPALQIFYEQLTKLRFGLPAIDALEHDIQEFQQVENDISDLTTTSSSPVPIRTYSEITLENVSFTYPGANEPALRDINLSIPANSTIGFAGPTGAGKTTLVDILLGLLEPDRGVMCVDDRPITVENIDAWQSGIGYVPQQIHLTDDTIAKNIAFGIQEENIDLEQVKKAAGIAMLHDFVINNLPAGYDTVIGEHGVRLSGGQRQRIGIARALYHDPNVLVLDEATSNLDGGTEKSIAESINQLKGNCTIIMIAHRLTTVKDCDCLYFLKEGRLEAAGTYEELIKNYRDFRIMA
ncbi:MAG: ABC transporter ATP-binding protein, partial [Lentisphaeria bacterium]